MSDQDRYIAGVPCWTDTTQRDPQAAREFYGGLFGWTFQDATPEGVPGTYTLALLPGGDVGAIASRDDDDGSTPPSWTTYIWVTDADETVAKVRAAGGSVLAEPSEAAGAGRMAAVADPAGAVFYLWQPQAHRGAAVVNEPGSVVFNTLETPDLDGARDFYGAVFGWELHDGFWSLPAYADFLERRTPGRHAAMADAGAPASFEAAVAAARAGDHTGSGARWDVTFAVADADAAAARARELGGRVDVEPFDAPWTRATVITDPQGATFVASQFVPENKDVAGD